MSTGVFEANLDLTTAHIHSFEILSDAIDFIESVRARKQNQKFGQISGVQNFHIRLAAQYPCHMSSQNIIYGFMIRVPEAVSSGLYGTLGACINGNTAT